MNKLKPFLCYLLVAALALSIGLYLRLYPLRNYVSFEANEQATMTVINGIRQKVIRHIRQSYPEAPPEQLIEHIKRNVEMIMRNDNKKMKRTIVRVGRQIDRKQNNQSYPYLLASDSYYYYKLSKNIQETGKISQTVKGSKYYNGLMLAPYGFWEPFNLHPYIGFSIYKTIQFFNPNVELMYAVSFTPLLLVVLTIIPFLFICRQLGCGYLSSFVGATYLLTTSIYLKRSLFGWYDNDPYNIFFPFAILALLLAGVEQRKNLKNSVIIGLLFALTFVLYAHFWHGWGFFLGLVLTCYFLMFLGSRFALNHKGESNNFIVILTISLFGSLAGISLSFGLNEFFVLTQEGWTALRNFLEPQFSLWPDIYIGVGELKRPPLTQLITLSGGYLSFVLAHVALFIFTIRACKKGDVTRIYKSIVLFIFLGASLILAKGALRFALFSLIPVSALLPLAVHILFTELSKVFSRWLPDVKFSKYVVSGLLVVAALGFVIPRVWITSAGIPTLMVKIYNTAWHRALTKIEKDTPLNSIVNSWWPPGHFIKAMANRRVTFDGATINFPQAYWLASALMTQNEKEALGILRMLNNSANKAAEYLQDQGWALSKSIRLLKSVVQKGRDQAKLELQNSGLNNEQVNHLLKLTHDNPPPSYYFLYNELIDKNVQLKFIGGWNFEKIEHISSSPEELKKVPPRTSPKYIQYLWDLVGGAYKYSGILDQLSSDKGTIIFEENVQLNLATKEVTVKSKKYGSGVPYSIFYEENGKVIEKKFNGSTLTYSVILAKEGNIYNCILLDRPLARSLLASLYFFEGKNLSYFKPFSLSEDLTRRTRIYVYEIDWDKFLNEN